MTSIATPYSGHPDTTGSVPNTPMARTRSVLRRIVEGWRRAWRDHIDRACLQALDDRLLDDIGMTREQVSAARR